VRHVYAALCDAMACIKLRAPGKGLVIPFSAKLSQSTLRLVADF